MTDGRESVSIGVQWTTRRRRAEKATDQQLQKVPSARTIARLMTTAREAGVPEARMLIDRFHTMIRKKSEADLDPWIVEARPTLIASFASGVTRDKAAIRAAITEL
jgi:transposase